MAQEKEDVKVQEVPETPKLNEYAFPELGITIQAASLEEAQKKAKLSSKL